LDQIKQGFPTRGPRAKDWPAAVTQVAYPEGKTIKNIAKKIFFFKKIKKIANTNSVV